MSKKKLPPGITPRGNRWRIDTFYKGVRIRETCATPEMAETNLRKIQTLVDEGRYLEKKRESKETLDRSGTDMSNGVRESNKRRSMIRRITSIIFSSSSVSTRLLEKSPKPMLSASMLISDRLTRNTKKHLLRLRP